MSSRVTLESEITRWSRVISLAGLVGLLILAGMTVGEVLSRWLLDFPILGVGDVSSLVVTVAVASCFPLVFAERRSITVRLVGTMLGPRIHSILDAFGSLVAVIFFCFLIWQQWIYAKEVAANHETTWVVHWTIAPWYMVATILLALCIPVQAVTLFSQVKSAITLKGVSEHKPEGHQEGNNREREI